MKIALKRLKTYIPIDWNENQIGDAFVQLGFEIESMETLGYCGTGPLVVGQVIEKVKHPDSDHLSVCKVDVGQEDPLQIVCGAQNFKAGDKVPVALVGSKLGEVELKKTNFRGWDSYGMMCSASELGLTSEKSDGLYILNDLNPAVGLPLETLFAEQRDVVFDIAIPANRGDCLSYLGLARELSALAQVPLTPVACMTALPPSQSGYVSVETENCDYFSGCLIENITVGPSPHAIQESLIQSGLRPINNIVDITNFILLEQGQPLHAFDAEKIQGQLHVKSAEGEENLKTLDGKSYTLPQGMVIISDDKETLSLAGIMGGASSEIRPETRTIFLECAHFSANAIQKAARQLNINTDSAFRFERFVDKTHAPFALQRALQLLKESCPQMHIRTYTAVGSSTVMARTLEIELAFVHKILGFEILAEQFKTTLERLNFVCVDLGPQQWRVTIPSYREDIKAPIDLVEEFVRLWGTDRIPDQTPQGTVCTLEDSSENTLRNAHAALLSSAGFYECYTDSLHPSAWYKSFISGSDLEALTLEKPLSEEHACLRYSLLPGLIDTLHRNRCNGNAMDRIFETGHIFRVNRNHQLCELIATAFVYCPSQERHWMALPPFKFPEAQALMRSLLMASGMPNTVMQTAVPANEVLWQSQFSGKIGLWEQRGFEAHLGYLNLNFTQPWFKTDALIAGECFWLAERIRFKHNKTFQPYSEHPVVEKDLALWVPQDAPAETVRQTLLKTLKKLIQHPVQLRDVRLFDVFKDPDPEKQQKSLAFTLIFGAQSDTLTEEAVNPIFERLQETIEKNFNYQVRRQTA